MQRSKPHISSKKILVATLNWGLGHSARSTPLIQRLLDTGHRIVLASDGRAGLLLQQEFPGLDYEELPAYNIRYSSSNMVLNIAWQWPKIISASFREHARIKTLVKKHQLDLIISDSRFGCFHPGIKSIFITHQLWIKTPYRLLSFAINKLNHWLIKQFSEYWIPDWPNEQSIAGKLSEPLSNTSYRYLGPLSRMQYKDHSAKHPLVALLSGPEPQRTRFEKLILKQAHSLKIAMLLIQGKPESIQEARQEGKITIIPSLSGKALNETLLSGELILCRAGYSSIMDLIALRKPAILIPTPGQTEQEYLAERLMKKDWYFTQNQKNFELARALEVATTYRGFPLNNEALDWELLDAAIASIET